MPNDQNFNELFKAGAEKTADGEVATAALGDWTDEELLELLTQSKKECFSERWIFERQWTRNIWYTLGRHWIEYHSRDGQWKDKRLAKWIPRPVTNKCKEAVQAIRAMFTAIKLGINCRPNGSDPKNVSTASTAEELSPVLYDLHKMGRVESERDWWLIVTGNGFMHTFLDYDPKYGMISVGIEACGECGAETTSDKLSPMQPECP